MYKRILQPRFIRIFTVLYCVYELIRTLHEFTLHEFAQWLRFFFLFLCRSYYIGRISFKCGQHTPVHYVRAELEFAARKLVLRKVFSYLLLKIV